MKRAGVITLFLTLGIVQTASANPVATQILNSFRSAQGLPVLRYAPELEKAARLHANDMLHQRFFSHRGSDGSTVGDRVRRSGYRWCFIAENLAQGQPDLAEVMRAWAQSPGHRANMLSPRVNEFAVVEGPGSIWVMILGAQRC